MHCEAEAQIGGKLAQLGSRLIDSTSRKLAANFFESFAAVIAPPSSLARQDAWRESRGAVEFSRDLAGFQQLVSGCKRAARCECR
ncbi:SRPBCC domain-containing protein [Bradyrhizobium sp. BR 1432]|uniref:SRPBCC domain-containing protein n=1 Tax=Bradyrhizobium sp. BR 1432 TaxID=3447966 RepID=UPI003EE80F97